MARQPVAPPTERISKRLSEGLDGVAERIDSGFASVRSAIDDLAEHVRRVEARTNARLEAQDATLTREFGQIEIGIGELRDRVKRLEDSGPATAAVSAALVAETVATTAQETAATVVATAKTTAAQVALTFMGTWPGKVIATCTGFTTLMVALSNVPNFVRGWDAFWAFLKGLGAK